MAQKPTIEQQVSILTQEQKNNVPKLFWFQIIVCAIALIISICAVIPMIQAWQEAEEAKEAYYEADAEDPLNSMDALEAWDEALEKQESTALTTTLVGGGAWLVGIFLFFYIKVKHPYYSDKLFFYLRKHG